VYYLAFIQEGKFLKECKPKIGETGSQDRGSFRLIVIGIKIALVIALICAEAIPSACLRHGQLFYFYGGLICLVAGALLRRHCFMMLGDHFKFLVTVVLNRPIIEQGAYKWIRHPSYLAGILMFLGVGLALTNWVSISVMLLIPVALYGYRIRVEEQALLQSLGTPYREYINRTKRLIPFLF